ncbi:hypothetical protein D3C76_1397580 [compost metagenome]
MQNRLNLRQAIHTDQQQEELIATLATYRVGVTYTFCQALGYDSEHGVTCSMSKRLVDGLEVVQVEHDEYQPGTLVPSRSFGMFKAVAQQRPVRQTGQRVP